MVNKIENMLSQEGGLLIDIHLAFFFSFFLFIFLIFLFFLLCCTVGVVYSSRLVPGGGFLLPHLLRGDERHERNIGRWRWRWRSTWKWRWRWSLKPELKARAQARLWWAFKKTIMEDSQCTWSHRVIIGRLLYSTCSMVRLEDNPTTLHDHQNPPEPTRFVTGNR